MSSRVVACPSCQTKNRVPAAAAGIPRCAGCKAKLPWVVDAADADFDQIVDTSPVVLVDLWAAWCGPCRAVAPVLEQLAAEHAGALKVVKVDVEANPRLAAAFEARSIPLLLVMTDGEVRERVVGAQPHAVLNDLVNRFVAA
ncbi:MAG: thioredoxin [Acidimicrobiales bacterium]